MEVVKSCSKGENGQPCGKAGDGLKTPDQCPRCWINRRTRSQLLTVPKVKIPLKIRNDCESLGEQTGESIRCVTCVGNVFVKLFHCKIHKDATLYKKTDRAQCCAECVDYSPKKEASQMIWQYGVTTVPSRIKDGTTGRTLESLAKAGFDSPRLFIDGVGPRDVMDLGLPDYEMTIRTDPVLTAGNWVLALYELWARNALADRYAIFQDDLVACTGLREYLEHCPYPEKGYLNLYTVPMNQRLAPLNENKGTIDGWFLSNQMGKGALALVFDGPAVRNLLGQEYLVDRFLTRDPDPHMRARLVKEGKSNEEAEALSRRCDRRIDGGIVDAMKRRGWQEWCHSPSLVDHTGDDSTMGNRHRVGGNGYGRAESFQGEGWDARTLIK